MSDEALLKMVDGETGRPVRLFRWRGRTTIVASVPNYMMAIFAISAAVWMIGMGLEGLAAILELITKAVVWLKS